MEVTKANLATYLAGLTPSATPYPIEITETVANDWGRSDTTGTVGNIINTTTPNGVYLDLGLTIIPYSVTNMYITFRNCTALTTAPVIPNSVIYMAYTFRNCTALTTAPVIPNSVTNMEGIFHDCTALTTAPVIPNSVTDMYGTFYGCTALTTAPVIPNSVTDMSDTFRACTSLTTAPVISNSVTNMTSTFGDCTALTTAPIIPSSVSTMSYSFLGCIKLHTIQNFAVDVDNCDMTEAFGDCPALANIYVTTLSESSWHLLHTDTGATGTDYTIYNPDGTVAGSGTVAGTSQVLTLYGKSDELVISANITPTLAVETATSQVQWHKSGLPYDDELMIFNAKNPDTVISNFITVNRAGEEFLGNSATATLAGRAKDSYPIPTDAVLQYSFDEIKQLPDNPAGTVYKRDNDWTTVDGWVTSFSSSTLAISGEVLVVTPSGTQPFSAVAKPENYAGKKVAVIVRRTTGTVKIQARNTSEAYVDIVNFMQEIGENRILIYAIIPSNCDYVRVYCSNAETFYVESIYIGDGSYLDPVIDNSYSEAHAENHGVIPVDGVCGKAGYFNNSYMIAPRPALGDDITIYFWAKFDALGIQTIVQSRTVEGKGLSVFQIDSSYRLGWRGNNSSFTGYTTPVNTWHHVCIKMNSTTAVLKINGELKSTLTGTYGTTTYLASNIWSGLSGTGGTLSGQILKGALDGLKIVPRFTTDDEDIGEYKARANHPKFYATADKWKTARNVTISDADGTNTGTAVSMDGSENETLKLPATIKATLSGNASTATKLATARKINGVDFDGSANITVADSTKAPTSHASSAVTYGVSSESNYGHAKASTVAGTANGAASKGTTPTVFAQSNHVHPYELETLKRTASFTLGAYVEGKKLRIANTHATNTITCTLPTGQTMNGQSSFTIAPDTILEFELIGTAWKCVSNKWELLWTNSGTSLANGTYTLSGTIVQFKYYFVSYGLFANNLLTGSHIAPTTNLTTRLSLCDSRNYHRTCSLSGTTFSAGVGYVVTSYATAESVDNDVIVPLYVYGMK